MDVLAFLTVAVGTCVVTIVSWCIWLVASVRVLMNRVGVSSKSRCVNNEVSSGLCDFDDCMMHDEGEYKVVLR